MSGFSTGSSANDWFTSSARQDVYASTTQLPLVAIGDCNGGCACDDGCCDSYCRTIIVDAEATFLKYGQEGGVVDEAGVNGSFSYEIAPRLTVGVMRDDGFGVRSRFWSFDHSTVSGAGQPIEVDTYTIDGEFFQVIDLCHGTSLDIAGGIRYLNFDILMGPDFVGHFHGFGVTTGLNLRKEVLSGALYAKSRFSLLADDLTARNGTVPAVTRFDHPVTQIELGIGYEAIRYLDSGAVLRLRGGIENQQWLSIVPGTVAINEDVVNDAAFFGFVTGVAVEY
jgi:hypothetical protein